MAERRLIGIVPFVSRAAVGFTAAWEHRDEGGTSIRYTARYLDGSGPEVELAHAVMTAVWPALERLFGAREGEWGEVNEGLDTSR